MGTLERATRQLHDGPDWREIAERETGERVVVKDEIDLPYMHAPTCTCVSCEARSVEPHVDSDGHEVMSDHERKKR